MLDPEESLSVDATELRAQALVLERCQTVVRSIAEPFAELDTQEMGDPDLAAIVHRSAAVLGGAAEGIADSLAQLSTFVHEQATATEDPDERP